MTSSHIQKLFNKEKQPKEMEETDKMKKILNQNAKKKVVCEFALEGKKLLDLVHFILWLFFLHWFDHLANTIAEKNG